MQEWTTYEHIDIYMVVCGLMMVFLCEAAKRVPSVIVEVHCTRIWSYVYDIHLQRVARNWFKIGDNVCN